MPTTAFAERVKRIRKTLDLSREAVARMVDVSTSTVFRWEEERLVPSAPTANIISAIEMILEKGRGSKLKALIQTGELGTGAFCYHRIFEMAFKQ